MYQVEAEDDTEDARPNKCKACLYYTWKLFTCIFSHIFLVSLVIAYCYLGAYVFQLLESENEIKVKGRIPLIRNNITDKLWNLTRNAVVLDQDNWTYSAIKILETFEKSLHAEMKLHGWDGTDGNSATQWTFAGALFYSIIVITTIGYGHIAPKTQLGKVVTIFYAILGIPLMLLCLSNIGDVMAHSFRFLYWRVCCYMCTKKPKRQPSKRIRSNRGTIRSSSGGRSWNKSRGQSFKHGVRNSTKSADSAIGLSETVTRSSYSDTECRYEDKDVVLDMNQLRVSQHSHSSDAAVPNKSSEVQGRSRNYLERSKSHVESTDDAHTNKNEPVLFNKYALDRDESMKAQTKPGKYSTRSLPRQKPNQLYRNPQYQSSPYVGSLRRQLEVDQCYVPSTRSSRRVQGSSPRIMTPMGFAVPRQPSFRSGKLRNDDYYDEEYSVYDDYPNQPIKIKPVPIWLCVFLVISYIVGGAFLFQRWECWTLFDAAYFCFITLTTIGFGDFVPSSQGKGDSGKVPSLTIALCSLYLLFGIALLAMSFNLVQEQVINSVKSVAKRLGIIKDDEEEE